MHEVKKYLSENLFRIRIFHVVNEINKRVWENK